jgi:hypothetical protein
VQQEGEGFEEGTQAFLVEQMMQRSVCMYLHAELVTEVEQTEVSNG